MKLTSFLLFVAPAVQAVELDWYISRGCHGERLDSASYSTFSSECYPVSGRTTNAASLIVGFDQPSDVGLKVLLYSDRSCNNLYEVQSGSTVCVNDDDHEVGSYQISAKPISRVSTPIKKRSPAAIQSGIDTLIANSGLDIAARTDVSDLAPPKKYDLEIYNGTASTTDNRLALVRSDHPYIAASGFLVSGLLTLSSLVTGCYEVQNASPLGKFSCSASLAATVLSFVGTLYHGYQGYRSIRATLRNNNVELGIRRPRARGLGMEEEDIMTISQEEYMEYILDLVGVESKHLGLTKRDEDVDTESPAYLFTMDNAAEGMQDYIFTIRADENGEVKHSISFAHEARIHKRAGYQGVHVNGGLDIEACQRSKGDSGDLPYSKTSAYSYFYDDVTCLFTYDELVNSNYLSADILDTDGYAVMTVGMTPYKSGQANHATARPACDDTHFYQTSSCIN